MFENELYKKLGFKQPEFLINPYGIRIYIGTKGASDWAVVIPNKLTEANQGPIEYKKDITFYLISEEEALEIANKYTEIARRRSKCEVET